ncbi:MAG: ribbon-helix-helix domain-containing protein [Candidatus Poribacteria bacterium]|nr:ribbon-helix-helix domain-containing protein [Candidatus Poribacteria bacterium]
MASKLKPSMFSLTEKQIERLEQESEETGLSKVEIVRRAIDNYHDHQAEKKQRLYFTPEQQQNIKKMSAMLNLTETQVIRQAIDRETRFIGKLKRRGNK